jgi:hypothetical protein
VKTLPWNVEPEGEIILHRARRTDDRVGARIEATVPKPPEAPVAGARQDGRHRVGLANDDPHVARQQEPGREKRQVQVAERRQDDPWLQLADESRQGERC